jgi:hypothetical protein
VKITDEQMIEFIHNEATSQELAGLVRDYVEFAKPFDGVGRVTTEVLLAAANRLEAS